MKIENIPVGTIGTKSVGIDQITIGNGNGPKGTIIALQHGTELSPLWITKELIANPDQLQGTATIIPIANPFGFIQGTRNEPIDNKNLNRQFPGNPLGDFSARLAAAIFNVCKQSDFVIDLHTFSRQSPFLVGYANSDNQNSTTTQKIVQLLQPDIIWKVNEKKGEDKRFKGSLDGALAELNIPSVFIEMPNYQMIQPEMISRIADGIRNVFLGFQQDIELDNDVKAFQAKYLYADTAGLFEPTVSLLETVKAGQAIGTVTDIPSFQQQKISTPVAGIVMTIKGNDIIRTGSKIASIGTEK